LGANYLKKELLKAKVVLDGFIGKNIVSLNSKVIFTISNALKPLTYQIVMPDEADLKKKKLSIFSPLAIALIGFKENEKFQWELPSRVETIKILKVINT
jgi:regulator of nucleoside diphosphate kinase